MRATLAAILLDFCSFSTASRCSSIATLSREEGVSERQTTIVESVTERAYIAPEQFVEGPLIGVCSLQVVNYSTACYVEEECGASLGLSVK